MHDKKEIYYGNTRQDFISIKKKGLTEIEFCKLMGFSKAKVSDWKSGRIKSYNKHLPKIAEVLGVSVDDLLDNREGDLFDNLGWLLSEDEEKLVTDYRELTTQGKEFILQSLHMAKNTYKKHAHLSDMEISTEIS